MATRSDAAHEKGHGDRRIGGNTTSRPYAKRGPRVMEIARAARVKGERAKEDAALYRKLLAITGRVVAQANASRLRLPAT